MIRGAQRTTHLFLALAVLAAAPVHAQTAADEWAISPGTPETRSKITATVVANPRIYFIPDHDTVFAGVEPLILLLERETRGNRLTVTVKLEQEQEWLADRSREITFSAGDSLAYLEIPASDFNERVTRSGTLTATLDDESGYETADAKATVLVVSTDGLLVTYSLSQPSYTFSEDVGRARAQLIARMAIGMPRGVTVGAYIGTRGNEASGDQFTATRGEDYEPVGGAVLMVAGKYQLEDGRWVGRTDVIVPLMDDDIREGTETFELSLEPLPDQSDKMLLQNADGTGCESRCRHLIHINDDEDIPALELSVSPSDIMEAGETSATATLSITDSKSFAADQSLTLSLTGTATRGADYMVSPADADAATADYQVILPVDSRSVDVVFTAMDDDVQDPSEKLEIRAMHDGNAVGAMQAIRIIDHGTIDIEAAQSSVAENARSVGYTVTARTGGDKQPEPGFSMEVPLRTADGSAHDEIDFTAVSTTLTFAREDFSRVEAVVGSGDYHWVASKQGEVALVDDETVEQEETFSIVLDAPPASSGFILGTASAEVAIANEDRWGFAVQVSPESIREGDESEVILTLRVVDKNGRFTANGHCVAEFPVTAALVLGGSASDTDDYSYTVTAGDLSSVRLAGCQPSRRVTLVLHALTDEEPEDTEEVTFTPVLVNTRLVDPDPTLHQSGSLEIANVPGAPKVSFSESSSTFAETARDAAVVMVARTASGAPGGTTVTFSVSSRSGTAASGDDFRPVSEVVTLREQDYALESGAWVARYRLPLTLLDDEVREGTESLDLILEHAAGRSTKFQLSSTDGTECPNPCAHPVHITDEEDIPELTVSVDANDIGEENETSTTVTVSITNDKTFATDQIFTLNFDGTATEGVDFVVMPADADRGTPGHQVILPAGANSIVVTITAVDDEVEDPNEEFSISLDVGGRVIDGGSIRIGNRPLGPTVEITFEGVQPPRDRHVAGTATGPFTARFTFSEPVLGFAQEDIVWQTHAGTTVDSTNIGVLIWDYTEVRAGLEYAARMMPTQDGRLHIVLQPGAVTSVAKGYGNQLGAGSLRVELPANRMMVAPATLTVDEGDGDGAQFLIVLTSEPTGVVTLTVNGTEGTAVKADPPTLTVRLPYWTSGRGVEVTAGRDANATDETVTLEVSASGGGYDGRTASVVVTVRDSQAGRSGDMDSTAADLFLLEDVTPEVATAVLFGEMDLGEAKLAALDRLGNQNGGYDLGDLLSWIERCRKGEARCGVIHGATAALAASGHAGRTSHRGQQDSGSGGRRSDRLHGARRVRRSRQRTGSAIRRRSSAAGYGLVLLLAASMIWACADYDVVRPPADPDPGSLTVWLTAPADGRDSGAMLLLSGPGIDSVRAPGLELFQSGTSSAKRIIVSGVLSAGPVLEFQVPDRQLLGQYRVELLQVAGEEYSLRDVAAYAAGIRR